MIIRGIVTSGAVRGEDLIKIYEDRIAHQIGYKPFLGTLGVKMEKNVRIEDYVTRRVEHLLLNGRPQVYVYLVPVSLKILKSSNGEDCWIAKVPSASSIDSVIEIIAPSDLRKKYDLKDEDEVEITFFRKTVEKKKPVTKFLKRLSRKETKINR